MANFSPELYKAASGAQVMPVSKERSDEPFESPVFENYRAKNDIAGYMTALWKGVAARDAESMRVLFYLSVYTHELDNAIDIMDILMDMQDEYMLCVWHFLDPLYLEMEENKDHDLDKLQQAIEDSLRQGDKLYRELYPEYMSLFDRFGDTEIPLLRAYINNVGRQSLPEEPKEEVEIRDLVPQETKDYWRSLYRRDDCSSNQESIYHEALKYAKKGDPYAMYIVGYLLNHGIRTKYSNPNVTILEADHEKALPWLKRAADAGIVEACWETACALWDACYVSTSPEECTPEMRAYIEKGAEGNDKQCLEWLYKTTTDDDEKSFGYLASLAAQNGTHKYKLELAKRYEEGCGCEKDEKKAFELAEYVWKNSSASPYSSAAEDSVDLLCRYLREGIGCTPDPERAGDIRSSYDDEEDRMWELLTK